MYDAIVTADTRELAAAKLWEYLDEAYPGDESDGGVGTVHPLRLPLRAPQGEHLRAVPRCVGVLARWASDQRGRRRAVRPTEFDTVAAARAACARYHSLIDLTELHQGKAVV